MKNKIDRAKEIIQKHRMSIAFSTGVLVGAGTLIAVVAKSQPPEIWLTASPESLQKLLDNSIGAMTWTHNTHGAVVNVVNENSPLFK